MRLQTSSELQWQNQPATHHQLRCGMDLRLGEIFESNNPARELETRSSQIREQVFRLFLETHVPQMLADTGLLGMIGKAERGPAAIAAIREFEAVYLIAIGGAAYLVSKAIKKSRVLAFADLGMEAIYEFEVKDMPVTVAVDSKGTSVHNTGPEEWSRRIAGIPILQ